MAVTAEDIKYRIVAENAADKAVKKFAQSIKRADTGVVGLSASLKALGGIAAGAFAVQGIRKLNEAVQDSIRLAQIQQDAEKKVADVIRSTGGAAGYSADQLKEMASSMQAQTRYGDEAILEMQSVLLTFRNVAGDTFENASMAVLDMATVMGTDLKSAAIQLGKALNDPVLGASAMSRAGIQFTEQQKKTLKALVNTNRMAEAQAIILKEIEGQMGGAAAGAAETYAGKMEQLSNKYGDLKEQIGFAVMESGAFDRVLDTLNPAVDDLTDYIVDHKDDIGDFAEGLAKMGSDVVKKAPGYITAITTEAEELYQTVKPLIDIIGKYPAVLEYGLIGAVIAGRRGAAIGAVSGLGGDYVSELISNFQSEVIAPMEETERRYHARGRSGSWATPSGSWGMQPQNAFTPGEGWDWTQWGGAQGGSGSTTRTSVSGITIVDEAAQKAKQNAQKDWNSLLSKTIGWYEEETESIEGLYDANLKYEKSLYNLALLRNAGVISQEKYIEGVEDATFVMDLFKASADGVLQADLTDLWRENEHLFGEFADTVKDGSTDVVESIADIANALMSVVGSSVEGIGMLNASLQSFKAGDTLEGILAGVGFIGSNIGGKAGSTISSTASMALAGASLGPVGAAVGGVVGLVSGLFGGGDDEEKRRKEEERRRKEAERQAIYNKIDATLKSIASPKMLRNIEEINDLYAEHYVKVGDMLDLTSAKLTELSAAVFGLTADTITTMLDAAIDEADSASEAGRLMAQSIEDQLIESFRSMALSKAVEDTIMPLLQPVLNELVTGAISGGMSPGEMADLVYQAKEIAGTVAPVVADIYAAFDDAGITRSIEGRAIGGPVITGRPYLVGEEGPELFVPGGNGSIVPNTALGQSRGQVIHVQIGSEEFRAYVREQADDVYVRAERRKGVVNAQRMLS